MGIVKTSWLFTYWLIYDLLWFVDDLIYLVSEWIWSTEIIQATISVMIPLSVLILFMLAIVS